jgi:hypothetical protein
LELERSAAGARIVAPTRPACPAPCARRFSFQENNRGGLASFKRANPWLADIDVLPYTLIYRAGEKVAEFAGGGISRLESRLERVRSETR